MNQTFIITGATGGIGKKIVEKLLKKNNIIIATDVNLKNLEALKLEFKDFKDKLIVEILDVRKPELWEKIIQKATNLEYPFYGLIHSAGVLLPAYIKDTNSKDIDFHFDINAKGSILGSQIASRYLIEKKSGHIIHISSLAGISPVPGIALYSASKFAVRGFSLALAMELEPFNVHVTCICPDAVDTAMLDLQKNYEEAALTFSGKRALTSDEVAEETVNCIGKKIFEIAIPSSRGIQAKFANLFPKFASSLLGIYKKRGLSKQKKYREAK